MIRYVCDSCAREKGAEEVWILGFAAESVGVTAARREVTISGVWDERHAREWLAVHFCSEACRDNYMSKLFGNEEVETEVVKRARVMPAFSGRKVVTMTRLQRTVSKPVTGAKKRKRS